MNILKFWVWEYDNSQILYFSYPICGEKGLIDMLANRQTMAVVRDLYWLKALVLFDW